MECKELEDEGYWLDRTTKRFGDDYKSGNWVIGLELKHGFEQFVLCNLCNYVKDPSRKLIIRELSGN